MASPPTWLSGSADSQRSPGSTPSATPDPSALHSQLPKVSSTSLGVPVEPLVYMTAATASRSWVSSSGASASDGCGSSVRPSGAPGTTGQPRRHAACSATAKSSPGGSAIPTRSPGATPSRYSARATRSARSASSEYVIAFTAARSGRRRAARFSQASTRMARRLGCAPMWTAAADFEDIRYETSADGIAKITINRPEVRNAFRPQTVIEMSRAFELAREDTDVGMIILTGEGDKAFCSGGDQRVRGDHGYEEQPGSGVGRFHVTDLHVQIRRLPKPVVAMVAGYAIGGGHVLHVCCDLTIAADNARFGQTGPRVGSFDGGFGATVLAAQIGSKRAKEVWFLCRQYDAQQALAMGLVNAVVPLERLEEETVAWCREMLALSPFALRLLKASFHAAAGGYARLQQLAHDAHLP